MYRKGRKRKELRQRGRAFSWDTVAVGTERNKEPHSRGPGVNIISDITVRYFKMSLT